MKKKPQEKYNKVEIKDNTEENMISTLCKMTHAYEP